MIISRNSGVVKRTVSYRFFGRKIRPSLDDVEAYSHGKLPIQEDMTAKNVHYRLNIEEREYFEVAKRNKFLQVKNFAHRRELAESPLMNLCRLYCDAAAIPFVCVSTDTAPHEGTTGPPAVVKIDLSPLRMTDLTTPLSLCINEVNVDEYPSIQQYDDLEVTARGHDETILANLYKLPIWKVPQENLVIHFESRSDGARYAKKIATLIEEGKFVV